MALEVGPYLAMAFYPRGVLPARAINAAGSLLTAAIINRSADWELCLASALDSIRTGLLLQAQANAARIIMGAHCLMEQR